MFTGIVEEIGLVEQVIKTACSSRLRILASMVLEETQIGDSICTSGVCLTVAALDRRSFEADVMAETQRCSKLGSLQPGSRVNLERAMRQDGRFGGHIVSGHIDDTGKILSVHREGNAIWFCIAAKKELMRYIVKKGSIAVDGVSLTVANAERDRFYVSVIPHTGSKTTLLSLGPGSSVNLECDALAKYAELQRQTGGETGLTEQFLKENGF